MEKKDLRLLANGWIDSWNNRDLAKIMDHYADDVELCSPFVAERWNLVDGRIIGKEKFKEHLMKAFESRPADTLKLVDFLEGVNDFILVYQNAQGKMSADLVELNSEGKVKAVKSFYGRVEK